MEGSFPFVRLISRVVPVMRLCSQKNAPLDGHPAGFFFALSAGRRGWQVLHPRSQVFAGNEADGTAHVPCRDLSQLHPLGDGRAADAKEGGSFVKPHEFIGGRSRLCGAHIVIPKKTRGHGQSVSVQDLPANPVNCEWVGFMGLEVVASGSSGLPDLMRKPQ